MSKIVFTTLGSYGDIYPYVAIGKELSSRGHTVVIATSAYYQKDIEKNGLVFAPVRPDVQVDNQELLKRVTDPLKGSEFIVRQLVIPHLRESYEDLSRAMEGADLLVSHVLTYAAPLYGEKHNIKWISTILSPLMFCSAYETPAFPQIPFVSGFRVLGPGFNRLFLNFLKLMSWSWGRPIRRFRKELGLPAGKDPLWEGQHSPHRVLALFSQHFGAPQPDWPPLTRVCGFPFHDQQGISPGGPTDPDLLAAFLEEGDPPVVFCLGSTAVKVAGNFYHDAGEAVQKLNIRAVLVAGDDSDRLRQNGFSPNILVMPWADYHHLFQKASAVVHSGGVGTTSQVLRAGVPQLVVPFANDQMDNADRVRRMDVGRTMSRRSLSSRNLVRHLADLLQDPDIRDRARQVGQGIEKEDGPRSAADEIETVLRG